MTKRFTQNETKLLKILINANSYQNINSLAEKMGFSKRSIYTFFRSISNKCLNLKIVPPRNVYHQGYFLIDESKIKIQEILGDKRINKIGKLTSTKRRTIDLLLLFLNDQVTTKKIIRLEDVSKNTILSDLNILRNELKEHAIYLESNQKGHQLVGRELNIRDFCRSKFEQNSKLLEIFWRQIQPSKIFSELLNLKSILHDWVKKIELDLEITYTDNMRLFFENYYSFVLYRMMNNKLLLSKEFISDKSEIEDMKNNVEFKLIRTFIIQFGRNLADDTDECLYLESLLLEGQRGTQSILSRGKVKNRIFNITGKIIKNFKNISGTIFKDETQLEHDLYGHLLATYYRVKYHHQYTDGDDQIKNEYPDIYTYTRISIYPFEKLNGEKLHENEISLIAIYFGAQIIKENGTKKSALIVCSSGIGTSRFLMAQLNNIFPSLKLIGPISENEYNSITKIKPDIVISTITLKKRNRDVITVNSILNESEINRLRKELAIHNIIFSKQSNNQLKSLLDVIADNAEINNISQLIIGLKEILTFDIDPKPKIERGYQPMLSELIDLSRIQFSDTANFPWEEAIKRAAAPLLINGDISDSYIDAMIGSVNKNGPYINIGSQVALAHARPEMGVKNLSMAVLKLNRPIDLVDSNHKIRLIFVLAAVDSTSHLKALSELANILGDRKKLKQLLDSKNKNEFLNVILRSEENETSSSM